jgi:hypothetical protein
MGPTPDAGAQPGPARCTQRHVRPPAQRSCRLRSRWLRAIAALSGQVLRVHRSRRLRRLRRLRDAGMATAEYAIATLAACGFAALLVALLRSGEVRGLLLGIIRRALASG